MGRFCKADDQDPGLVALRQLQIALDLAVARAYGWTFALHHRWHGSNTGGTPGLTSHAGLDGASQRQILQHLLALNQHQSRADDT